MDVVTFEYNRWIEKYESFHRADPQVIRNFLNDTENLPHFSFIIPTWNTDELFLRKCLDSILAQSYPFWEVCIVDNGSSRVITKQVLQEYEIRDKRFHITYLDENTGISRASNIAIQNSLFDYIALLDHDDTIDQDALFEISKVIVEKKDADIIYSDEDKIEEKRPRTNPYFKPDWSPELLLSTMYVSHLTVYRKEQVIKAGMFRSEYDGTQDYDLMLRVSEIAGGIYHIPKILYHWRKSSNSSANTIDAKSYAVQLQQRALQDALNRRGLIGQVLPTRFAGNWRVKLERVGDPKVSILVTSTGKSKSIHGQMGSLLLNCLNSIQQKSNYQNFEIIVLHEGNMHEGVEMQLKEQKNIRIKIFGTDELNNSEKINYGVESSQGEYLFLMDESVEILSGDWIENLLGYAQLKGAGAVGGKLLRENDVFDSERHHWIFGASGYTPQNFAESSIFGHGLINVLNHNQLVISGACMMVGKSIFMGMKGWDRQFSNCYNHIDFSLRLTHAGYRNIVCPDIEFRCWGDAKSSGQCQDERIFFSKWGNINDPYFNPNFYWDFAGKMK